MTYAPAPDRLTPASPGQRGDRWSASVKGRRGMIAGCYLLLIVSGALLVAMREINAALSQMRTPGSAGGGALQFPLQADPGRAVEQLRGSWEYYLKQVKPIRLIHEPTALVGWLVGLDLAFILCYTLLLSSVLLLATRFPPRMDGARSALWPVHRQMLRLAQRCTLLLAVVDVLEDLALYIALHTSYTAKVIGPIGLSLSLLKLMLAGLVMVVLLIVAVATVLCSKRWRDAMIASRAVLIVVASAVLLLATGIGADQIDDVIRAWDGWWATFATVAAVFAALVVVGAIIELTGRSVDHPAPDSGGNPQPFVFGVAIVLGLVGGLSCWLGWGWGLLVPAGMALVMAGLSVPIARLMPKDGPAPRSDPGQSPVAGNGVRMARAAGAGLLAALVWVLVRAASFDLVVRAEPPSLRLVALGCAAVVLAVVGAVILLKQEPPGRTRWAWGSCAAAAALILVATLKWPVPLPIRLGTVAVLMFGVAALAGALTAAVMVVRWVPVSRLRLVPAVRVLGLQRLPVVILVMIWALLVAVVDRSGFHDIRTLPAAAPGPPPTLEQAYRAWLAADAGTTPPGAARPLVLVAAQGGGIRAAVWTALVMECVFGPGPVAGSEGCVGGAGAVAPVLAGRTVREQPLPVFLASGASGGSVGLAGWSARRVDLAGGGAAAAGTPKHVEDALSDDFVAPDLARMLTGDLTHLLLAHHLPDRAMVMEWAWERPWARGRNGLARGLRETYQQANGGAGQWRIPVLALNGMQVEDGCRLLASPVDFHVSAPGRTAGAAPEGDKDNPSDVKCTARTDGGPLVDVLPRTTELVDYLCPATDVPLSTAAHLSARFPFVSPTGRVTRADCDHDAGLVPKNSSSFDIDGGMFDNSGANTASDAWRALAPLAAAGEFGKSGPQRCVVPLFLQIDNSDPAEPELGRSAPPLELFAPVKALFGEIGSRETVARAAAKTQFGPPRSPAGSPVLLDGHNVASLWFRVALAGQPGPTPPLGWTLAGSTVADMRAQLSTAQNRAMIAELRHLLTAPLRCG